MAAALVTIAGWSCAHTPRHPPSKAASLTPVAAITSSLHAIASAQERYYADHGTYSIDIEALQQYPGCTIRPGVTITIHTASAQGWAASGTHPGFPDRSCVQMYSEQGAIPVPLTHRDARRADEQPGGVVCDAPPP
jgi:hypothetical protein